MTFEDRLAAIRANMTGHGLDALVAIHDGAHFIETPNPVMVLTRFRSLGPAAVVLRKDGEATLIVTPAWDGERAAEGRPGVHVIATDDVVEGLRAATGDLQHTALGIAGLPFARWEIAGRVSDLLPAAGEADAVVFDAAAVKTDEEIA